MGRADLPTYLPTCLSVCLSLSIYLLQTAYSVHLCLKQVQQSLQERQPIIERPLSFTERTLQERPLSFTEMTDSGSVRDSVGSFRDSERESITDREWEDYTANLGEVLQWLTKAEDTLKNQERISGNVDVVKDQFHEHEVRLYGLIATTTTNSKNNNNNNNSTNQNNNNNNSNSNNSDNNINNVNDIL